MASVDEHYAAYRPEDSVLGAIRVEGHAPENRLAPDDLGTLDHYHTGRRRATLELLELVPIRAEDRVLDLGTGLGGPARLLASARGWCVVCLAHSADYCAGARLLNRLTVLDDRIAVQEGSALNLPFPASSFDVVWMQNVGINIEDKPRHYAEIHRVLTPGGRFAFQEIAAGDAGAPYFPAPWATDPADSFLVPVACLRSNLEESGFVAELFEDTSDVELSQPPAGTAQGPLTL